jgi:hypothetical protein
MQHQLSIGDRLRLLNILPPEGDLTTIRIVRELRESLSFTEAELADAQIKMDETDGQVVTRWKQGSIPDKTIDIGPKAAELIRSALGELDKAKKLRPEHLVLIDMFEYGRE